MFSPNLFIKLYNLVKKIFFFFFFFFFFFLLFRAIHTSYGSSRLITAEIQWGTRRNSFSFFRAAPEAYGSSQARGCIRAVAAGLCHSHSNMGSKTYLQPTPQLTATLDH